MAPFAYFTLARTPVIAPAISLLLVPTLSPPNSTSQSRRGRVWYCKATLTGRESEWIKLFAMSDRQFPHHSTNNQVCTSGPCSFPSPPPYQDLWF